GDGGADLDVASNVRRHSVKPVLMIVGEDSDGVELGGPCRPVTRAGWSGREELFATRVELRVVVVVVPESAGADVFQAELDRLNAARVGARGAAEVAASSSAATRVPAVDVVCAGSGERDCRCWGGLVD